MQLAIILSIVISIPVVVMGFFLFNASRKAVNNSVLNNHEEIAVRAAQEIDLFFKRPEDVLTTTAAMLGSMNFDPWRQETMLVELALTHPVFMGVTSFDLSGNQIAGSNLGKFSIWRRDKDTLSRLLRGNTDISELKFKDGRTPYITMTVPVKSKNGIGSVLVADIDLRSLWDIVDAIRLGRTGRVFLVSKDGVLIAHPDKKRVIKNENLKGEKDVDYVLSGNTGAVELQDKEGKMWVSSYAPIGVTGWSVVLRQEQKEAYAFSRIMKIQSWIVIILSEILAVLSSLVMARFFANPIKALISRIKNTVNGGLEEKILVKRHDEIGELNQALNELTEELNKARTNARFSSIGETSVWVAHELKNSLVPIKSFVQLLSIKHKDGKFIDKFSNVVPEEIERCERLLKELSDFSLFYELRMSDADIKAVMSDVLKIMEDKLGGRDIKIQFFVSNDNFYGKVDSERLKRVFLNLIINAADAMPVGGILSVSMNVVNPAYLETAGCIEIKISDNGIGIPVGRLKNLFEPFRTTKKGGLGLGLTISRRIIEQHGGHIRVESQPDKGTVFTINLPKVPFNQKGVNSIEYHV